MRSAPLSEAPRFPVTVGTGLVALAVTIAYWSERHVGFLMMEPTAFLDEPWRLVSAIFPHGSVLHLCFNLYWLWVFGSYLERAFGHAATALLFIGLAATSSAAQFAISGGGIGLSGVGYGLLGFLWATERYDPRYRDAMDARTVQLFLVWGVLCIALTAAGLWNIANTAHGTGLVFGVGIGAARALRGRKRWLSIAALLAGCVVVGLAATALRPSLALFDRDARSHCYFGYRALEAGDDERALWLLERAAAHPDVSAGCVLNTGIALARSGRPDEAARAFERAEALDPALAERQRAPADEASAPDE